MTDRLEPMRAQRTEEVAELTGEAEEDDETGAPEKVAETASVPIEPSDELGDRAPRPFIPEETPSPPAGGLMTEPMYSTDEEGTDSGEEPGDYKLDQEPAAREPRPGNVAAPGQRPSASGSTPSDIPTEADENAHRDHTLRRRPT